MGGLCWNTTTTVRVIRVKEKMRIETYINSMVISGRSFSPDCCRRVDALGGGRI